jgi:polar amino acid transport system permease protein
MSERTIAPRTTGDIDEIRAVPVRHPGRWLAAAVLLLLAAMFVHGLATNPAWKWDVVGDELFSNRILQGLLLTVELTVLAMVIGVVGGVIMAIMRMSANPVVSSVAWLYIWFFRGVPVLVQLVFWAFLAKLYPYLSLGIPFGQDYVFFDTNQLIPIFGAAVLGFGLNEAAYMAEIVRAGILSVGQGQTEAAEALGMRRMKILRRIVLPQAMRFIIPPTGNETISMLKETAIASLVAVGELFTVVRQIYGSTYQHIPLLVVASIWYLVLTSVLSVGQYYIERHYSRGVASSTGSRMFKFTFGANR